MLPRPHRLTAKKDFSKVFSKGRPVFGRGLTMKAAANGGPRTRVGFVVSTKVSKKAVERNKLKRRMREAMRKRIGDVRPGFDIVFMAKGEALSFDAPTIDRTIMELLRKARLITAA